MDTDIVLRSSLAAVHNAVARQTRDELNGAFLAFDKGHEFLKRCLERISGIYDPYNWPIIGPVLVTRVVASLKQTPNEVRVLSREAFYSIGWDEAPKLIGADANIVRDMYDIKGAPSDKSRHFGYHFWSRSLFQGHVDVSINSFGGWALLDT